MSQSASTVEVLPPVLRPLGAVHSLGVLGDPSNAFDLDSAFSHLRSLPHCVWLDSVSDHEFDRGRYSFLTADPVAYCNASLSSPDPWPVLQQWCRGLQFARQSMKPAPDLTNEHGWPDKPLEIPPFWGGIVGMLAYESAWWLEPSLRDEAWTTKANLPGIAMGVYDWAIAVDHLRGNSWLISTGLNELFDMCPERARRRADGVMEFLGSRLRSSDNTNQSNASSERGPRRQGVFGDTLPDLASNFTNQSYSQAVAEIIDRICRGDSFQVNLAQTLSHPALCEPSDLYRRLRTINPAPYAAYLDAGEYQVISSSPEGFLQVRCDQDGSAEVVTRPIKGTVPRTGDDAEDARLGNQLLQSQKDRAENVMIVDLMRNDLSRVCTDASVQVTGLCELERYQRVQHLVSTVRGTLREDCGVADLLAACFPGGSITGAPKVEAMRTIAALEARPRGPYCGSIGYVSLGGAADFNILIRTVTHRRDRETSRDVWEFPVGGGITARSDPNRETEETWVKAASLLEAIDSFV